VAEKIPVIKAMNIPLSGDLFDSRELPINWIEYRKQMKKHDRWHVETYSTICWRSAAISLRNWGEQRRLALIFVRFFVRSDDFSSP
jgi:hypothetical protein